MCLSFSLFLSPSLSPTHSLAPPPSTSTYVHTFTIHMHTAHTCTLHLVHTHRHIPKGVCSHMCALNRLHESDASAHDSSYHSHQRSCTPSHYHLLANMTNSIYSTQFCVCSASFLFLSCRLAHLIYISHFYALTCLIYLFYALTCLVY